MASNDANQGDTQLFLLRIWRGIPQTGGEDGDGSPGDEEALTWHGKVQHVLRGEAHSFSGWVMLVDSLEAMLLRDLGERARARPAQATKDEGRRTKEDDQRQLTTDN